MYGHTWGQRGGRLSQVAGWDGLPVAPAETLCIFISLNSLYELCFACHFKTGSVHCLVITHLFLFFPVRRSSFFFFFHVMKNWWATARVLFIGIILPLIKVGFKVSAHIQRWTTVVMSKNCVTGCTVLFLITTYMQATLGTNSGCETYREEGRSWIH